MDGWLIPEMRIPAEWTGAKMRSVWTTAGVTLLLALYFVMALGASLQKGPSFDEEEQLAVGYNIWLNHDLRMEGADGDLIKRWATLPYLISRPHPAPIDNDYWRSARPYRYGFSFFFQSGNQPGWLLLQARFMNALLGLAMGLLIFYCSRELFGASGGLFSLLLFAFSPHMLAFGGMVSTDMSICLTLLGSTWAIWRLLHRVTWGRVAWGLVFVSLLMLAKPSALVIFPITFILILIKLFSGKPLEWELGRRETITSASLQLGVFAGLFVLHGLVAWTALWAHYDFRFHASPNPGDPTLTLTHYAVTDPVDPRVASFMDWLHDKHILPEGFLQGIHTLLATNERRQAFMDGEWTIGGWSSFFLHALWDKTSPVLMMLLAISLGGWKFCQSRRTAPVAPTGEWDHSHPPDFYEGMPYFVLIIVYFIIAMLQEVNIGHRHVLPIYPPLYVLGGALTLVWQRSRLIFRGVIAALLAWFALESSLLYPDYLAYFNPLVGGASKGYEHLVDSSLDWGMDLPKVKQWLDKHDPDNREPVYLAYFGTDSPDYHGIVSFRLPGNPDWRPYDVFPYAPGFYVISATLYESVYTVTFGPWNSEFEDRYQYSLKNILAYEAARNDPAKLAELLRQHPQKFWDDEYGGLEKFRFGRLCAWLRHHRPVPDAAIGHSILIWHLDAKDIEAALLGPPPEIDDSPLI